MKVLIVGAGLIGGHTALLLREQGHEVFRRKSAWLKMIHFGKLARL